MSNVQIFTPNYIAELMLNQLDYTGDNIKTKTIFEPSFGDGAFLTIIVKRILDYCKENKLSIEETHNILNNVYGVELDKKCYNITIKKLNDIGSTYGIEHEWKNIVCENTLHYVPPIKFDLCVANPPYQKIHNLDLTTRDEIKKNYKFGGGNTDLYVVFFEYCLKIMNESGKLCFITPNSYFKNSSQGLFRKYLAESNLVKSIIDYGNVKVFGNVGTYTAIVLLDFKNEKTKTKYTLMKNENNKEYQTSINLKSFGKEPWIFTNDADAKFLAKIAKRKIKLKDLCDIQYGLATNADKVYIIDKDDAGHFESDILRPITKASTLNSDNKVIFPYEWNEETNRYMVIKETDMQEKYPKTYQYLKDNKAELDRRSMEKNSTWYQYARGQGIQNSNNKKIAFKRIISDREEVCEIAELDESALVYAGIYIVVKDDKDYELVKSTLLSKEFHKYLLLVSENMTGGYRNVDAKMIKEYGVKTNDKL